MWVDTIIQNHCGDTAFPPSHSFLLPHAITCDEIDVFQEIYFKIVQKWE